MIKKYIFIIFITYIQECEFILLDFDRNLIEFRDPCAKVYCPKNEICIAKNELKAICISKSQIEVYEDRYKVVKRDSNQLRTSIEFCGNIECRFGECEIYNTTTFICHCFKGVTGVSCNVLDKTGLACSSNPCFGDSFCIDLSGNPICICEEGRVGPYCTDLLGECSCKNGGICVQQLVGAFRCKCLEGFGGPLCQYKIVKNKYCESNPCLNGGTCQISQDLSKFICKCVFPFYGKICENQLAPVTRSILSFKYEKNNAPTTKETIFYLCSNKTCLNGGTCIQLDYSTIVCLCINGFYGPYCNLERKLVEKNNSKIENLVTKFANKSIIKEEEQINSLQYEVNSNHTDVFGRKIGINKSSEKLKCPLNIPNPCLNNGVCHYIGSEITCKCVSTYTGTFCTERISFCKQSPCQNGGTCTTTGLYDGKCICIGNFTGRFCELGLDCNPNPCKNNQPCLIIDGFPRCFCTANYSPPFCE